MSASTPAGKVSKSGKHDPAHDVLHSERHPLEAIFKPKSVAVIGATEWPGSIGRNVLSNLHSNPFGGTVYPVNKNRPNILGIKTYPTVADVPVIILSALDPARASGVNANAFLKKPLDFDRLLSLVREYCE